MNPVKSENVSSRTLSFLASWEDISETGPAADIAGSMERSVQLSGEFDGAVCVIQGSNDGVEWFDLTSPLGALLSFKKRALEGILESVRYIRPFIYQGRENTKITCRILYRQGR